VPCDIQAGRLRSGAPTLSGPFLDPLNRCRQRDPRVLQAGNGPLYVRQSEEAYESAYRLRLEKALTKKAASLDYKLVPETTPT
jgi:hypothetical protein